MKIYVITHKKYEMPNKSIYQPLHVGVVNSKEKLGYLQDDEGENISSKNKSYCELTGLYWIWKNSKEDIVGITHYRRHFFKNLYTNNLKKVIDENFILNKLKNFDIIVPQKHIMKKYTVREEYERGHYKKDLDNTKNIISSIYPEYIEAFDKVMNSRSYYQWNMFITKKEIFDCYSEWLFNVLFELEKITDTTQYDDYNKRIYGFLSERLFNVWLEKQNLKIEEVPVVKIDESTMQILKKALKNCVKNIICKI